MKDSIILLERFDLLLRIVSWCEISHKIYTERKRNSCGNYIFNNSV